MIDEFTFCDDCGAANHTWESCPDTKDIPSYDPDLDPLLQEENSSTYEEVSGDYY